MYARMVTARIPLEKMDDGIQLYREEILPPAEEKRGFRHAFLLTNRDNGTIVSLSLWATEEAMQASEEGGFIEQQVGKVAHLIEGQPRKETYEVSVDVGTAVARQRPEDR